jgi:pilus assembly protein CpaB
VARVQSAGKIIAVIVALVLAVAATVAIFLYVQGIEQRAFEDAELVEVLVAQEPIPEGTSAAAASDAGLIVRGTIPRANVPTGPVLSLEDIEGLVARDAIPANEVLVQERWVDPTVVATTLEIPEGFEALSVQVAIPPGVAGFISAGDRVSLIATIEQPDAAAEDADDEDVDADATPDAEDVISRYLLQGIEVLAIGQPQVEDEETGQPSSAVLLTIALEPQDAERVVFAIENAALYFTLLPPDAEPQETPGRTLSDLFD